jgi:molybdopterin/thiamine biosynthesis adenylyltransferase
MTLREPDILAASQPLRVPGTGEVRVLTADGVERLAAESGLPRRLVEAAALEAGVSPLHYLRNLAEIQAGGQARLLRATVALAGSGPVPERAVELLARKGVGRCLLLLPPDSPPLAGERLQEIARNRNASCEIEARTLNLREGNPAALLAGVAAAGACLEDSADEQLLQFACRVARVPLVLTGAAGHRGQATTVRPGDAGCALIYRPAHPHLEPRRRGVAIERRAGLMVGTWLAEQMLALLLDSGEILADRLLYADMEAGEMAEYPLG